MKVNYLKKKISNSSDTYFHVQPFVDLGFGAPFLENPLAESLSGRLLVDLLESGEKHLLKGAELETGQLISTSCSTHLGVATLVSPKHIIVARHVLNGQALDDMQFTISGNNYEIKLVEDGADNGLDYAILEVQDANFSHYARLRESQPPISSYAVTFNRDGDKVVFGEDKPVDNYYYLSETNYLSTEQGMSGSLYRDYSTGEVFAIHIKQAIDGIFRDQNTGALIKDLCFQSGKESVLSRLVSGELEFETNPSNPIFDYFSTATNQEVDQGDSIDQVRSVYAKQLNTKRLFSLPHCLVGPCEFSGVEMTEVDLSKVYKKINQESDVQSIPIVIEVNEISISSIKTKITGIKESGRLKRNPIFLVVGFNERVEQLPQNFNANKDLVNKAKDIAQFMKKMGVAGACFPYLWRPTSEDPDMKGYVFPYLEGRALLYLHPDLKLVQDSLDGAVYRWMDADVSHEPLFAPIKSKDDTKRERLLHSCLYDLHTLLN